MSFWFKRGDFISDRYLVLHCRSGGYSEVFLTFDFWPTEFQCRALKTFKADFGLSQAAMASLQQEAASWVSLGAHPNIVQCFFTGKFRDVSYLVLEWVSNERSETLSLRDKLLSTVIPTEFALGIGASICDGLIHCAEMLPHFAHGDIKPENILLGKGDTPKLTDFGLARTAFSNRWSSPDASGPFGTPPYMAPELWENSPATQASDIYAIGCLLYELTEGRLPFSTATLSSARRAHLSETPSPAILMNAACRKLVDRCLSKDPHSRPSGYEELAHEITIRRRQVGIQNPSPAQLVRATDYGNTALALTQSGEYDAALVAFKKALEMDPTLSRAYNNRAILYSRMDRFEEALDDWKRAIEIDPGFVEAYDNRAQLHLGQERLDIALQDAERAVQLSPNYPNALATLGIILTNLGRTKEALQHLQLALEIDPHDWRARFSLGEAYRLQGEFRFAALQFSILLRASDVEPEKLLMAKLKEALCWIGAGFARRAFSDLDGLVGSGEAASFLAEFFQSKAEDIAALRYWTMALQLGHVDAEEKVKELVVSFTQKPDDRSTVKYLGYRNWTDDPEAMVQALAQNLGEIEVNVADLPGLLDRFVQSSSINSPELCKIFGAPEFFAAMEEVVFPLVEDGTLRDLVMRLSLYRATQRE